MYSLNQCILFSCLPSPWGILNLWKQCSLDKTDENIKKVSIGCNCDECVYTARTNLLVGNPDCVPYYSIGRITDLCGINKKFDIS